MLIFNLDRLGERRQARYRRLERQVHHLKVADIEVKRKVRVVHRADQPLRPVGRIDRGANVRFNADRDPSRRGVIHQRAEAVDELLSVRLELRRASAAPAVQRRWPLVRQCEVGA